MRIIDKNKDFYDYLQDQTDNIVFDRRDSFLLTKELFCEKLRTSCYYNRSHSCLVLLQVCHSFWLFLIDIMKFDEYDKPLEYKVEFIYNWKDYQTQRVLIALNTISFGLTYSSRGRNLYDKEYILSHIDDLTKAINYNDYHVDRDMTKYTQIRSGKNFNNIYTEKHIPLLKACGLAEYIDPLTIFLSFEEYWSLEKSSRERTDALGTTNTDKIEMHGFDKKTSFRGKNK